jgi:D-alanyl-D-alanine carboxypeptidase
MGGLEVVDGGLKSHHCSAKRDSPQLLFVGATLFGCHRVSIIHSEQGSSMPIRLSSLLSLVLAVGVLISSSAWSSTDESTGSNSVELMLAEILDDAYAPDAPGACAIVVKEDTVLFRGARGLANVELGVALQPESVLRIGSVTKQFTAAAILLLAREGKIALSDPLTKFLPEYPLQGQVVTIQHLLSHTSGIRNYTELPEWASTTHTDLSVEQLINVFKDKPFDFVPGERWKYDNSGYVLLGAVIERVSGESYSTFVRTRIFDPLGMSHTRVDEPMPILQGRAAGYARQSDHWSNAPHLSMTHPYAAGALVSSIDDLARWNAAIDNHELLSEDLWKRATTSFVLADGTPTRYGAGWIMGRIGTLDTVEHGGGINGFNAYVLRVPSRRLFVAVLANAAPPTTPPQEVALKLATTALGTSLDVPEIAVDSRTLDQYVGTYATEGAPPRHITRISNRLYADDGKTRLQLTPIGRDLFEAREDHSHFHFVRQNRRVNALSVQPRILMGDHVPAERVRR